MENVCIYYLGTTPAIGYAHRFLADRQISFTDHVMPEISHVLLDVPSFWSDGVLKCGRRLDEVLQELPVRVTVLGGNLADALSDGHQMFDLLDDPLYVAENAAITAECAIKVAFPLLKTTLSGCQTLIIGWGRIGKCLAQKLSALGTKVTVAARNPADRAMLTALGYGATDIAHIPDALHNCRLLFNTVSHPLLMQSQLSSFPNCIKIDLASAKSLAGTDVIWARGLPGVYAPEASGHLIAKTVLNYLIHT